MFKITIENSYVIMNDGWNYEANDLIFTYEFQNRTNI